MSTGAPGARNELVGRSVVRLFEQARVEARLREGTLPAWAARQYEAFDEKVLGEREGTSFPCHFGVEAQENGGALYTFVPRTEDATPVGSGGEPTDAFDDGTLDAFAETLRAYLETFRMHGPRTSLVTLFEPPVDGDAWGEVEYREVFWAILQHLHGVDDEPWPAEIPTDPSHPRFEFCYAGEPIFVTGAAPFYEERASRHNPNGLEVTFQPRSVFEGITGDTAAGQHAREQIQDRIESYDDVPVHGHVGDWEDDDSHEWKQYLLPTAGDAFADDACPLDVDAVADETEGLADEEASSAGSSSAGSSSAGSPGDGS